MRTSAAIHMRDLAIELHSQGHHVVVLVPSSGIERSIDVEWTERFRLIRVKGLKAKGSSYSTRLIAEIVNPWLMRYRIQRSNFLPDKVDGIIWYSPSIFFTPLIRSLSHRFNCSSYLISRDLFPRWALDLGILKKGLIYQFLRWIELSQYKVADVIGIQAPSNALFFQEYSKNIQSKIEVLWTWVSANSERRCSIDLANTKLAGKKVFLYAGNMGAAQNLRPFLELALLFKKRSDIGFLMLGRGDERLLLEQLAVDANLENILFLDEIDSSEIPALCAQSDIGIVSLDLRHTTHNIPGKFLTYMSNGLPVLAKVNLGNDLIGLISEHEVGVCVSSDDSSMLAIAADSLLNKLSEDDAVSMRCRKLADELFSTTKAAKQIINALQLNNR